MYKKVLVTLDGSELSETVLPQVKTLTAGTDATVTLFRVVEEVDFKRTPTSALEAAGDPSIRFGTLRDLSRRSEKDVDQHMMETLEHVTKGYLEENAHQLREAGVTVRTAVRFGDDPAETILEYAQDEDIDLIVMATHGRTGLGRIILGSVAGRLLEKGGKPLLLVRPKALSK